MVHAEERRQAIERLAAEAGRVEVAALADRFDVSGETIRRDLDSLERRGVLRRVHGGAMPVARFRSEPALSEKTGVMTDAKRRIAKAAVSLLPSSGSVLLDAGSTTAELARRFPETAELTVCTNSAPLAMTLATRRHLQLLLVGGRVRGRTLANVDDWALRTLGELHVDVAFVAANGVSLRRGLSTHDVTEAAVKRAMVAAARRVVLLADHTKIGDEHLVAFAPLDAVDTFVTDADADPGDVESFEDAGVAVVLA